MKTLFIIAVALSSFPDSWEGDNLLVFTDFKTEQACLAEGAQIASALQRVSFRQIIYRCE